MTGVRIVPRRSSERRTYAANRAGRTAEQAEGGARSATRGAAARAPPGAGPLQPRMAQDAAHAGAQGGGAPMSEGLLRDEINKRLTLNWLIQGAAQHAGMTLHHLVRDEINAIDPRLIRLYDQYALINLLQYWQFEGALLLGWPPRFWRRASSRKRHPFFGH